MYNIWEHNKRNNNMRSGDVGMIPNAPPCFNLDHVAVGSTVKRVSSSSSSTSSSNPFSNGFHHFSNDSAPPFHNDHYSSTPLWLDSESSSFFSQNWVHDDDLRLFYDDFSRMNIIDGNKTRDYDMNPYDVNVPFFNGTGTPYRNPCNAGVSLYKGYTFGTPVESSLAHDNPIWNTNQINHHNHLIDQRMKQGFTASNGQVQLQEQSFVNPYLCDPFVGSETFEIDVKNPFRFSQSQIMHPKVALNPNAISPPPLPPHCSPATKEREMAMVMAMAMEMEAAKGEFPQCWRNGSDPATFRCDNSIIIQGKDMQHCIENNGHNSLSGCKKGFRDGVCENNNSNLASDFSLRLLLNFYSLAEVHDYIYNMAKDQNGCRFLQRMVDEGNYEDMRMVFEGIIDNVVELMMDPFGNYLVQKLLDVCSQDQRLQIVLMLTNEPGQLVRISLNTHGTRVVQKLIETLNSAKQISLVKSAIQPGFLDLIKDLNGNHVIQRCLQCLSCQDNEFIFDASVKFCVEIAIHRHGCCVLQRCIDHSVGKHRDKLITEICKHGLLLAQDPFGNYVVQHVIEMGIPTISTKLCAQFKGNYVHLSTQKFSSHVVQRCLEHVGDSRSRIVREFLSVPRLDQLLQDPFANYVIQTALATTKGSVHASLAEALRPYKMLRTSPYCKGIFSGNLLKK